MHAPGVPTTDKPRWQLASPRSAILTCPLVPLTSMLSHLRSLWTMGGSCACRYSKPSRIWKAQRLMACSLMSLCFLRYLQAAAAAAAA